MAYISRSMLKEDMSTSLQRMLVSAKTGDSCGLWLWCRIGWLLSALDQSEKRNSLVAAQQQLVYLTLAEMAGTSGEVFVDLVKLHRDGTCTTVLKEISVFHCL